MQATPVIGTLFILVIGVVLLGLVILTSWTLVRRKRRSAEIVISFGGGSVMPTTTASASSRWIASSAILSATPNDAHAATGANAGPTMRPSIEICEAGMFEMFQSRFGETAAHGSSGHPHFLFRARMPLSF